MLDTPGGPDDMARVVAPLPLERDETGVGARVASVRDRLPSDLVGSAGVQVEWVTFETVFQTRDEFVAEIANRTVHALLHLGWVEDESEPNVFRVQVAVLVKTNGLLGQGDMTFVEPFRYLIVYPALLRTIARCWAEQEGPRLVA